MDYVERIVEVPDTGTAPRTEADELTNPVRARFGRAAIEVGTPDYGANENYDGDPNGLLVDAGDAIANIMHHCNLSGIDPDAALSRARSHYCAEAETGDN